MKDNLKNENKVKKVIAYITREKNGSAELLSFTSFVRKLLLGPLPLRVICR